jgi:mannosyltransferase
VVSPLAFNAALHGGGATRFPPLDPDNLGTAFLHLFTSGTHPVLWMGALLPFSVLGLTRVTSPAHRFVARIAAAWALVPPAVMLPAVMVQPNLLLGRYLMFVVPAWAVLGGLGVATVFELLTRLARLTRLDRSGTVAGLLTVALLGAAVWTQIPALVQVRWPSGHGEDIRPALAAANSSQYVHLPMYVFGRYGAIEIGAYDRRYERRMIGMLEQRTLRSIWPSVDSVAVRSEQLRLAPELVLLMRTSSAKANCTDITMERTSKDVVRCMPAPLRSRHYRVLSFRREGRNWTFALLRRPTPATPPPPTIAAALGAAARQIVKS